MGQCQIFYKFDFHLAHPASIEEYAIIFDHLSPTLLQSVQYLMNICKDPNFITEFSFWPVAYFMRLVCRKFSFGSLALLMRLPQFSFIKNRFESTKFTEEHFGNSQESIQFDFYLVYGKDYGDLRSLWMDFFMKGRHQFTLFSESLSKTYSCYAGTAPCKLLASLLALHKVRLQEENSQHLLKQSQPELITLLAKNCSLALKPNTADVIKWVFENVLEEPFTASTNQFESALMDLEVHFKIVSRVVFQSNITNNLLFPLCQLSHEPERLGSSIYLPTMPSDELFEVRAAIQERGENLHYFFCPNGHGYAVGTRIYFFAAFPFALVFVVRI